MPVATVIVGGLVSSTLCEFLLRPGLFWALRDDAEALPKQQAAADLELASGTAGASAHPRIVRS